jgi:hypothetical protein
MSAAVGGWFRSNFRFWRDLAALSLLAMGLGWVVPWFRALSHATYGISNLRAMLVLGGLGFFAFLAAKLLASLQVQMKYRHRAMLVLLVLSMYAGLKALLYAKETMPLSTLIMQPLWAIGNFASLIPNEFLVIMAVLFAWRRGAVLALDYISPELVQRDLKVGFAMFLLFVGINTLVTGEQIEFEALLIFYFFAMLAMGAARMSTVGELRGGFHNTFDRKRLAGVMFGTVFSVGIAYWAGVLMGREDAALAAGMIGLFVLGVLLLSIPLLLAILYLVFWLLLEFQADISPVLGGAVEALAGLAAALRQLAAYLAEKLAFLLPFLQWLARLTPAVRFLFFAGSILIVILLILLVFYIRERRRRALPGAEHEGVLSLQDFLAMLRDALRNRLQNAAGALANALNFQQRRRLLAAARVRRIYWQLMELAHELGHPRPEAATPAEFLPALQGVFPLHPAELSRVTDAYQRVRYGELPETRAEVDEVEQAWEQIKAEGQAIKQHPQK